MDSLSFTARNTETFWSQQTIDVSAFDQPLAGATFLMDVRRTAKDPGLPVMAFKSGDTTITVVSEDTEAQTITLLFKQLNMKASGRLSGAYVGDLVAVVNGVRRIVATADFTFTQGVTRP